MNKEKKKPLAERLQELAVPHSCSYVESLEVLSQGLPFFFQGVAALTGMRCYRENMDYWSRWEMMEEKYCPGKKDFSYWLDGGGWDQAIENNEEFLTNLLLEPMYWLEECAKTQEDA